MRLFIFLAISCLPICAIGQYSKITKCLHRAQRAEHRGDYAAALHWLRQADTSHASLLYKARVYSAEAQIRKKLMEIEYDFLLTENYMRWQQQTSYETKRLNARAGALADALSVKSLDIETDSSLRALLVQEAYFLHQSAGSYQRGKSFVYKALYEAVGLLYGDKDFNTLPKISRYPIDRLYPMPDGKAVCIVNRYGALYNYTVADAWAVADDAAVPLPSPRCDSLGACRIIHLSPDRKRLLGLMFDDNQLIIKRLGNKGQTTTVAVGDIWVNAFFAPHTPQILAQGRDSMLYWIDYHGKISRQIPLPYYSKTAICSDDGRYVVTAADNQHRIDIWAGDSGVLLQTLWGESFGEEVHSSISALAIDGKRNRFLAVGYTDGQLQIWDLWDVDTTIEAGKGIRTPDRHIFHTASIRALDFDAAGRQLAVGSLDKIATLWTLQEDQGEYPYRDPRYIPIRLEGNEDSWVTAVAFSGDGKRLFTGYQNGTVRQWETKPEPYAAAICKRLQRSWTADEWLKYVGTDDPRRQKLYIRLSDGAERNPSMGCGAAGGGGVREADGGCDR